MRALIIEDNEFDARLLIHELRRGGAQPVVEVVDTAAATRTALTEKAWDLILADWTVPGFGALPLLAMVRELGLDTPVIVVSGMITEDYAVSAMRAGAHDFVLKERLSRLLPAIERELRDAETRAARRRAEHELQASAVRYRELFESSPLPMWVYDRDTLRFLMVNDAAVRHYGYTRDEFFQLSLADLRPPEDREALRDDVARHVDGPRQWRHVTRRGDILVVEITAHDLEFEGRRARLVLANDVTERLRLEDQLRQSQKMEAIGRLAAGVAHDFNNILCVIMGYSETLMGVLDAGECRDDIEQIHNAGRRGVALTRQLLMFNRQQPVELGVLDVNEVLNDMTKMLERLLGAGIALAVHPAPGLGHVRADHSGLEQVIMNLVVNARDAMPGGGSLAVETSEVEVGEHELPGIPPGRYVVLAFADTGVGMDAATQARIFEPFFTTKDRGCGTGLGLSTVFGIMQQSHGHVRVASEPGRGATFRVYLPRVDDAAIQPVAEPPVTLAGSETVLVVDDDDQVRAIALAILRRHGYEVLAAHDGAEAERRCASHPSAIHLLLTDVVMPGMTGIELARRLRGVRPEMKVLCMSGYADEVVRRAELDGEIAYLPKPFTAEALSTRVRRVIDGERPAR